MIGFNFVIICHFCARDNVKLLLCVIYLFSHYRKIKIIPPKLWRLNIDPPPPEGASGSFEAEERWWDQVELTRLDLSSNDIHELSEDIENFNSLVTLDVRQ